MSVFSLVISCLTTSNFPWFMDLTFQVPVQYCSLQHRTWLPSPVTSTTGCCFCFGFFSSLFLELFLHCSPVAYCSATNLGSSSFSVYLFAFSYCSWGSQGKNTEVVCHFREVRTEMDTFLEQRWLRAPERMSRNDAQLWMCLVMKVKSDAAKNSTA